MRSPLLSLSLNTSRRLAIMPGCLSVCSYSLGSSIKRYTINAARMTKPEPSQNGKFGFILYNMPPVCSATIVPTPPMKLITPFACERNSEGVISGMSATTGVRHNAALNSSVLVHATNNGRIAATGINPNAMAVIGAPIRMNGIRLPSGVRNRSDHAPTGGWINNAAMLSSVIKKPIIMGER